MNQGFIGWPVPVPGTLILGRVRLTVPAASMRLVIPTSAANLRCLLSGRTDAAAVTETLINLTFNDDAGANYTYQTFTSSNTTNTGADGNAQSSMVLGRLPGVSSAAGIASGIQFVVFDYANTTLFKSAYVQNAHELTTGGANRRAEIVGGFWHSTAPITTLTVTPASGNFVIGTLWTIYGDN